MQATSLVAWDDLEIDQPVGALVGTVDLVIVRHGEDHDQHSVLYGRCLHRGALLADGTVVGQDLICGLHGWDYRVDSGISAYNNSEQLAKFTSWVSDDGEVMVDGDEIASWADENPQPYNRDAYQGAYQDPHGTDDEPHVSEIRKLASEGLSKMGHHGPTAAMGVSQTELPSWDDIQFVTAQLARRPLLDDDPVAATTVIGPRAEKPLELSMPIFVSDMSFGALSEEAKVALSRGAERAGTGICSGEGGMLPEEKAENSRYFYELASGRFGWSFDKVADVAAFHFKFGQGAKTGTGGHLPGSKVTAKIAEVRDLDEGEDAISPATFTDLVTIDDYRQVAARVREASGGVPIGAKLSAQHIDADIDAALEIGVDYIILDGRGGGTGAAPTVLRNNISVPTIPALARARRHLDSIGCGRGTENEVTLVATGGLRTHADFAKALALGADAVAVANSAIQAIGCLGMRACNTNSCTVGIATQKQDLRARLIVDEAADRLERFLTATVDLMAVIARACGHSSLAEFTVDDLTTFDRDMAHLAGIAYGGVGAGASVGPAPA